MSNALNPVSFPCITLLLEYFITKNEPCSYMEQRISSFIVRAHDCNVFFSAVASFSDSHIEQPIGKKRLLIKLTVSQHKVSFDSKIIGKL